MRPPLTLIGIVKPKTGCRVPRREGLRPTGSHRAGIGVLRREELGPTGSHRVRFESHPRKELRPTGSHTYGDTCLVESAILGLENAHASGFNVACPPQFYKFKGGFKGALRGLERGLKGGL